MCCVSGEKMAAPSITLFPEKKSPTNGHGSPGRAGKTSWVIFTFFFYRLISSGLNVFNSALSLLSYGPTRVRGPSGPVLSGVTITSRVVFHSSSGHYCSLPLAWRHFWIVQCNLLDTKLQKCLPLTALKQHCSPRRAGVIDFLTITVWFCPFLPLSWSFQLRHTPRKSHMLTDRRLRLTWRTTQLNNVSPAAHFYLDEPSRCLCCDFLIIIHWLLLSFSCGRLHEDRRQDEISQRATRGEGEKPG